MAVEQWHHKIDLFGFEMRQVSRVFEILKAYV